MIKVRQLNSWRFSIVRNLDNVTHRRPTSIISVQSAISDGPNEEEADEFDDKHASNKCCTKPFVFRILKLNSPEIGWIILGCITSVSFGAITPVSSCRQQNLKKKHEYIYSQIFSLLFTNVYGLFAERDIEKAEIETRNFAIIIFFIGVAGGLCQCLSSISFSRSGEALTMRMRIISFASMLRQEIGWFDREENRIGALVTQLSSDAANLKVEHCQTPNKARSFLLCFYSRVYQVFEWVSYSMHLVRLSVR